MMPQGVIGPIQHLSARKGARQSSTTRRSMRQPDPALSRRWTAWILVALLLSVTQSACSLTYKNSNTPRTPIEQLLLSQSLERSLTDAIPPVLPGQAVVVEVGSLSADQAFAGSLIERWLVREGLWLPKDGKEALLVRVTLHAFGTDQAETFFGIPAIQSSLIPMSLPELAFYKAIRQRGYARLSMDILDKKTGQFLRSTPLYEGDTYFNQYTVLLLLGFRSTDLLPPPL
jgi:hypothetical protein